jgi:2-oxoglutarate dehydrogenase E2 component (dihydrolipoamide succinyltransferase)
LFSGYFDDMAIDVKIPAIGESITEGTLVRWLKKDGDLVREGEPLLELETDKATGEIPSPAGGKLVIRAKEGETVAVGAVIGQIEAQAGPAARPEKKPTAVPESVESSAEPAEPAAPPVREKKEKPARAPMAPPPPPVQPVAESVDHKERETRKPMSRIRKTIAERLVAGQKNAAILTTFNEADMTEILATRAQFKEAFKERHGVPLGFMPFFVKATVEALRAFPVANARIDGDDIVYQNFYDIGVAVSTERGLIVPVIRDADRLGFAEVEKTIQDFAARAREGKIAVEDLRGGTFTITNGGVFGSLLSTPLLNPPQSAILGMHTIQKRPVARNDEIVIRPMMYLALSYDHRLIDGREAVQFLIRVKECIETPGRMLLGI